MLLSVEKTVVEGAGGAGLAALFEHPEHFAGRVVGTILSGGNIDLRAIADVAMRELARSGHLLRFTVPIADRLGALAEIGTVIGEAGANILSVSHDRISLPHNQRGAILDVVAEIQDAPMARPSWRLCARVPSLRRSELCRSSTSVPQTPRRLPRFPRSPLMNQGIRDLRPNPPTLMSASG